MGDKPGHAFHGNQYTEGGGGGGISEFSAKALDQLTGRRPPEEGPDFAHLARENSIPADAAAIEHAPSWAAGFAAQIGQPEDKGPTIDKDVLLGMRQRMQAVDPNLRDRGRPEAGKVYALTGGTGDKSIAKGNTWAESEVKQTPRGQAVQKIIHEERRTREDAEKILDSRRAAAPQFKMTEQGEILSRTSSGEYKTHVPDRAGARSRPVERGRSGSAEKPVERTRGQKAYARRKEREQIMRDSGLVKVKGARGGTYWE